MPYQTPAMFADIPEIHRRSVPLLGSILIHGLALGIAGYGILYRPTLIASPDYVHYTVRHLTVPVPSARPKPRSIDDLPREQWASDAVIQTTANRMGELLQLRIPARTKTRAPQTLIQPDLRRPLTDPIDVTVPSLVIWRPGALSTTHIVPPAETSFPRNATDSLLAPNAESTGAILPLAASDIPTRSIATPEATTSPVNLHQPDEARKALVTLSQTTAEPTPVPLISISDFHTFHGQSIVPPATESQDSNTGDRQLHLTGGTLNPSSSSTAHRADEAHRADANEKSPGGPHSNAYGNGTGSEQVTASPEAQILSTQRNHSSGTLISLPKDGKFGAVIVGASIQDWLPDLEGFWAGRLTYSVSIRVGLPRSWILQYSLPRSTDASAPDSTARLEAPWPYSILRPDIPPGSVDANALLVSGIINQDGQFESLHPIFPPRFPDSAYVIDCLKEWRFRPAAHNGHPTTLDIILIIPTDED